MATSWNWDKRVEPRASRVLTQTCHLMTSPSVRVTDILTNVT
ncbi:hypothetical protein NP493_873g01000 [Ridgeia piscesae]|uniref:Uncharacterized protein n=1 Tax=Ridgeia piscesae TaxID=27915 RepID=A0AAD9NM63_RIDPI|nr:hypothetical protein NP493_873g01000 [Ridgeia piscesae]